MQKMLMGYLFTDNSSSGHCTEYLKEIGTNDTKENIVQATLKGSSHQLPVPDGVLGNRQATETILLMWPRISCK